MTVTTATGAVPSTVDDRSPLADGAPGRTAHGPGGGDPVAVPPGVTVLPGGIRMRAPGHEPPPVVAGVPAAPAAPAAPSDPAGPAAPVAPPAPAGPAAPAALAGPGTPAAPASPAAPTTSAAPAVPAGPATPAAPAEVRPGPAATEPADRDRVRARTAELVRAVVEVLAGRRPPGHLTEVVTPPVLRYLTCARPGQPGLRARPAGRGGRAGTPGCAAPDRPRRRPSLHLGHPHPDAVEACTTVQLGGRIRALALRLDRAHADAPWAVTAVRLV